MRVPEDYRVERLRERNSLWMSMARVLRMSGQFSLKVMPSIRILAPLTGFSALIIIFTTSFLISLYLLV